MVAKGDAAARHFKSIVARLPREMMKAEEENSRDVLNTILKFSSGEISAYELAQMGHPYFPGRTPPQDPAIINVQSGEFVNNWSMDGPRVQGDGSITTVFENNTEYAHFLEDGTEKMIARPLKEAVEDETEKRVEKRRDDAIKRAFSTSGVSSGEGE